jgi:hypothetical protein
MGVRVDMVEIEFWGFRKWVSWNLWI